MGYKILVTPIAQTQFEEAITYYLKVATVNVALNFSNVVEKAYSKLEINPHFQIRVKNYRAIPTETFPYLIFFEILKEENIVKRLSVFNTHQNSKKYPLINQDYRTEVTDMMKYCCKEFLLYGKEMLNEVDLLNGANAQ